MNTPNLDALIKRAASHDPENFVGSVAHRKFCDFFGIHGPALVDALKNMYPYMRHATRCRYGSDTPDGDFCTCAFGAIRADVRKLLSTIDQEATCQK